MSTFLPKTSMRLSLVVLSAFVAALFSIGKVQAQTELGEITFDTSKEVDESFFIGLSGALPITFDGVEVSDEITGADDFLSCSVKSSTIKIKGSLTSLECAMCGITNIDVSKCPTLESLTLNNNTITTLDLSKNAAIKSVKVFCNDIKGGNASALMASLPDRTGKEAGVIAVYKNAQYLEKNVFYPKDIAVAKAKNWTVVDEANNPYEGVDPVSANVMTITTEKAAGEVITFKAKSLLAEWRVEGLDDLKVENGTVTGKVKEGGLFTIRGDVDRLEITNMGITKIDVKKNPALTYLNVSDNKIDKLEFPYNSPLTTLICNNNLLADLSTFAIKKIAHLECNNNKITMLVFNNLDALTHLSLAGNKLSFLSSSLPKGIEYLDISKTGLTKFNVSSLDKLRTFVIYGNGITSSSATTVANGLPTIPENETAYFIYRDSKDAEESNNFTNEDLEIVDGKRWIRTDNNGGKPINEITGESTETFSIEVITSGKGNVTLEGVKNPLAIAPNTEVKIVATPENGNYLESVKLVDVASGTSVALDITKEMKVVVDRNYRLDVAFRQNVYKVTLNVDGPGTALLKNKLDGNVISNLDEVAHGTEILVEATPNANAVLKEILVDDSNITDKKEFSLTGACTVKVVFTLADANALIESAVLRIYPNPATQYVTVETIAGGEVALMSIDGVVVMQTTADAEGKAHLVVAELPKGTYLVRTAAGVSKLFVR